MKVALLPGDGIGPEVTQAAARVLEAAAARFGFDLDFAEGQIGFGVYQLTGSALPDETLDLVKTCDAALLGAVTTPPAIPGYRSPILGLRQALDLYACVRPVRSLPGVEPHVDLVVVRENTEGLYAGREREGEGWAVTERLITRKASERILRFAFELARDAGKERVTVVHKANVLRLTCGLFRAVALEVAAEYPELELEEMLVDTCAMELARRPERFQVIVTTNLFGDILSDVACIHGGGLGLARSANLGERHAVFEPVHGSAPDIAGKGIANPLAAILSGAWLLDWLGQSEAAGAIQAAAEQALAIGHTTPDLGGTCGTEQVAEAVIAGVGRTGPGSLSPRSGPS